MSALFAACTTTPTDEQKPADVVDKGSPTKPETSKVEKIDITKPPAGSALKDPLKDPNNILSKRTIYFDFDKFEVKEEFRPIVEAHAKYLRENPGRKVLIQG